MKDNYKAIFFDWDGTAVISRKAPTDKILPKMIRLLKKDIILIIISGTTYENIAGGKLHELVPEALQKNLFLGLARGVHNYGFSDGKPFMFETKGNETSVISKVHQVCFEIHKRLFEKYNYNTDIVFTRPSYCKIDLLPNFDRKTSLFMQAEDIDILKNEMEKYEIEGGINHIIAEAEKLGAEIGLPIKATTDAKYLEVGLSTKSDNVDFFMMEVVSKRNISIEECCFWGDEFTYIAPGIKGSDAFMITDITRDSDFFDVSESPILLPKNVVHLGGGINTFARFLDEL